MTEGEWFQLLWLIGGIALLFFPYSGFDLLGITCCRFVYAGVMV